MSKQKSAFEVLGIPVHYDVDLEVLRRQYFDAQSACHPDRFVHLPPEERLVYVEKSAELNDAYQTLVHPLKRAEEILKEEGIDCFWEKQSLHDSNLLADVLSWQEELAALQTAEEKEAFKRILQCEFDVYCSQFMVAQDKVAHFLRLSYLYKTIERF